MWVRGVRSSGPSTQVPLLTLVLGSISECISITHLPVSQAFGVSLSSVHRKSQWTGTHLNWWRFRCRSTVACQCGKTAVHLRSQTQNPHATEIHQLPDLPFLSLYSAHLPLHPVCRAGCSRKEEVLLIFSMCFTFLIGETGCLLLFLCFKWCDSWLGLVLNKQQNIRQIEASETFWFIGKPWAHPQPQVTGWVGEASRF